MEQLSAKAEKIREHISPVIFPIRLVMKNRLRVKWFLLLYIPEEIRNLKILIVDDEEYNRLLFKTILNRWNVKYSEAENGMEAIEMLKNNHL